MATLRPAIFMNTSTRADLVRFVVLRTQRWGRVVPRIQTVTPSSSVNFDNDGRFVPAVRGQLLVEIFRGTDLPFVEDNRQFRPAFFFGRRVLLTECPSVSTNCFDFDTDELRYAAGFGLSWLSGFGPLTFCSFQSP